MPSMTEGSTHPTVVEGAAEAVPTAPWAEAVGVAAAVRQPRRTYSAERDAVRTAGRDTTLSDFRAPDLRRSVAHSEEIDSAASSPTAPSPALTALSSTLTALSSSPTQAATSSPSPNRPISRRGPSVARGRPRCLPISRHPAEYRKAVTCGFGARLLRECLEMGNGVACATQTAPYARRVGWSFLMGLVCCGGWSTRR